ncbi:hypothetical protein SISNIDRAFT_490116 [Sistotremastrum niveocremeum HHB9708]|uniref:Uncharacterized protein n=2 Tax=Sistotremastraceae TaxID=3402574 RepID=A0A164PAE6_9AGAM|nr:hypothetical protein SISNIDRAFT_490116 [Sistotremastrum niveocremeum HHB9708]KZT33067.1 hypothetical protein SISSUDRAFT_1066447 [Sistotremastrum suecicum HHB10207 ss-3]
MSFPPPHTDAPGIFRRRARLDPGVYDLFDFNNDTKKAISELSWVTLRILGEQGDAWIGGRTRYPTAIFQRIVSFSSVLQKDEWARVQLQSYADERGTNPPNSQFYCEILMGVGQEWLHLHRMIQQMLKCRPVLSDLINFVHTRRYDDTFAHLVGYWFSAEDWVVIAAADVVLKGMVDLYRVISSTEEIHGITSTLLVISRTAQNIENLQSNYRSSPFHPVFVRLASFLRGWHLFAGPLDSLYGTLCKYFLIFDILHPGWGPWYLYTVWQESGTPMSTLHHRFIRVVLAKNDLDADPDNIDRVESEIVVYLHKLAGRAPYIPGTKHDLWNGFLGCDLPLLHQTFREFHMPMLARRAVGRRLNHEREEVSVFYAPSI